MQSVTIGTTTLQSGQVIDYLFEGKIYRGKILQFRVIDKNDMNATWMEVQNVVSERKDWISFKNWKEYYDAGRFVNKVPEAFMQTTQAPTNVEDFI